MLFFNLTNTSQGMLENPMAWKCLNMAKQYISFVERVVKKQQKKKAFIKSSKENDEQVISKELITYRKKQDWK